MLIVITEVRNRKKADICCEAEIVRFVWISDNSLSFFDATSGFRLFRLYVLIRSERLHYKRTYVPICTNAFSTLNEVSYRPLR